jgi:ribosomal protein S18 acetylase RimI-like enzyme
MTSVSFTLVAEPEVVRARVVHNLLIREVTSESRPTTFDAWAETYQQAFEQSITVREVDRWKMAMKAQEARFFVGFRRTPTLRDSKPGQAAVVGQLVPSHGIGGIYRIGTVPMLRGQGYASAMTAHIAHEAAEAGLPHVYATVRKLTNRRVFEGVGLQEMIQTQIWR